MLTEWHARMLVQSCSTVAQTTPKPQDYRWQRSVTTEYDKM